MWQKRLNRCQTTSARSTPITTRATRVGVVLETLVPFCERVAETRHFRSLSILDRHIVERFDVPAVRYVFGCNLEIDPRTEIGMEVILILSFLVD